ncbi:MAG: hypothetical protein V2J55_18800, partial [Candidatus Competibacteraceae bacterium]|nr:hypothetical protein [Candidatus Competibacteraceae bacterium]
MTFDTLETLNGQTLSHSLSVPPGAVNLSAVATDSSGFTELFVAGNGVYRFTLETQRSGQDAIKITDSLKADARTELQVLADSTTLSVWFLDQGVLSYVQGTIGATPNWTTPMPLKKDVGQIAALRNTVRNTNELFDVDASEQLTYFYQDPGSTLWKQQLIALADVGKAIPFQCYTTVIHFTDQDGLAWSQEVGLSATGWIYVTVNGQAHILDEGTSTTVTPDASGSITVISKTSTTSTPVLTFGSTGFKELFDVNPQWVVNDNLKRYKTGQSVSGGKTQNGEPILGNNSKISADQFSSAVNHFTAASDAASSTGVTVRKPGSQPSNRIDPAKLQAAALTQSALSAFAVTDLASGTPRMLMGNDAMAFVPSPKAAIHPAGSVGGDIEAFFGDVWSAIYTGLKEVDTWVLNVTEAGLQFVVHLAEGVATFILDTIEKVYEALAWVLQKIEMALEKFIQWLGQLLGWDDIIKAHKVMANGVNQLFDWASAELSGLQTQVDKTFDTAAKTLTGHALPPDIATQSPRGASNSYQSKQSKDVQKKSDYPKSPAGSFSSYHIKHSGPSDSNASVEAALGKALADFLSTAETAGSDIYGTVKSVLQDIMKGLSDGSMTLEQIFKKIVDDIVSGVLQTTRDVINGVIKVVGDLVNVIKAVLNKSIDIPFITALYQLITGDSELTLLNLFSFILAIPATVMLKIAGAGTIFDDLMGLDDKNKTPAEFMALISQRNQSLSAAAVENFENSAALKYSYIGGAVFIVTEIIGDVLATAKAAGAKLGQFVAWIRVLIQAIITGATFPAIRDPAYEWRLIAWCLKLGLLATAFALAKEGSDSAKQWGGMNIALGIAGTITAIAIPITNQLADAASDLTWMALVGNLGNNLGGFVGSGIAVFDPVPGTKKVLAVVAGVGFAIKVVMDGTRF